MPREALALLARHPDVAMLFTDVGLPGGMNGRQLADAGARSAPGLRVLFTTAYARNAIVAPRRARQGGPLLPKPYTVEALGRKLREVLDE